MMRKADRIIRFELIMITWFLFYSVVLAGDKSIFNEAYRGLKYIW